MSRFGMKQDTYINHKRGIVKKLQARRKIFSAWNVAWGEKNKSILFSHGFMQNTRLFSIAQNRFDSKLLFFQL